VLIPAEWDVGDLIAVALVGIMAALVWLTRRDDMAAPLNIYGCGFCIHHDEKQVTHEGRHFAAGRRWGSKADDYYWPVTAAIGVGGPWLAALGMRSGGMTLAGLRGPFIVLATLANLALALALTAGGNLWLGPCMALLYLVNYETFSNWRHALPEIVLALDLGVLALLIVRFPVFYLDHLPIIAFVSGVVVVFKPHFPVYVGLLLGSSLAAFWVGGSPTTGIVASAGETLVAWIGGCAFFEALNLIGLKASGTPLRYRWTNLRAVLTVHAGGKPREVVVWHRHVPQGLAVAGEYFFILVRQQGRLDRCLALFAAMLLANPFWPSALAADAPTMALLFFHLGYWLISAPLHFYPKRALGVTGLSVLTIARLGEAAAAPLPNDDLWAQGAMAVVLAALLAQTAVKQYHRFRIGFTGRNRATDIATQAAERLVPAGAAVYAQCFAARFLWRLDRRIISGDNQLLSNADLVDKAEREGGRCLILTDYRHGSSESVEELSVMSPDSGWRRVGVIELGEIEADMPMRFHFFERVAPIAADVSVAADAEK
jgi:hypothetical protein